MPKVSIVMPAYNAAKTIETSIRSALAQSFGDFELLVLDDGSKDETMDIVRRLAGEDERIRPMQNPQNMGVSATRNRGVAEARGEWIAFLDSDDLWRADKLEKQLAMHSACPEILLSYTGSAFIDHNGALSGYIMEVPEQIDFRGLLRRNILSCSSAMVQRELMLRHPMGGDHMHEDYATWLGMLREIGRARGLNEPLLIYRLSPGSRSSARVKAARMSYHTYRHVGFSQPAAAFLVFRYVFYSVAKRAKIRAGKGSAS